MPFITTELRALAEALKEAGYQDPEVREADDWYGPQIRREVERFVVEAAPGDHLLLVLSGHGFHQDGSDFLITGPAVHDSETFEETCLRIEFGGFLKRSGADQFVVAVDACRAPLDDYTKAGGAHGWSKGDIGYHPEILDQPRYAHVYACTRYGKTGFQPAAEPDAEEGRDPRHGDAVVEQRKGFSYFTRALTEIARDSAVPGLLGEMEPVLDERVRAIACEDRGHTDQCVQINFATGKDDLLLFPDRGPGGGPQPLEHPWQRTAFDDEAWRQVRCANLAGTEQEEAVEQVRDAVVRLVGLWGHDTDTADAWLAEHGDIWRPAGSENRMGLCVATMLRSAVGPAADLSLTEAALLAAAPFLYTVVGTRLAYLARAVEPWTVVDGPPAAESCGFATREAFERYCGGHQALKDRERRARERGRDGEARAVAWWLARQWLLRMPVARKAVRGSGLAGLESLPDGPEFAPKLVREALAPARLWRLAELIGLDLEQWRTSEPDTIAALDRAEHTVDWYHLGTLLTVAHHMAVDPVMLSSLVAEHFGISAPVDGEEFRATLRGLTWQPDGSRRVLSADCSHEAVELALREHTDALDHTVRAVLRGPVGERVASWGVPTAFSAGRVGPGTGADKKPRYYRADVRFRLAGDRVRDLLMGEQLYQDRTLALRELYQNALDACRYRSARAQLWNLEHADDPDPWQGQITFTQGVEDGRPYIECRDNGIGMGHHELRHLFAFAGSRFVEEREFLEERAEWARQRIAFHPNSRFGIGVLSYFMLADEIRVRTSRMPREPGYGDKLVVDIDGPGALFRVRSKGPALSSGTEVRLYLRNPDDNVSCGAVLRKHLWVSDFSVTVCEGNNEPLRWRPGQLSDHAGTASADLAHAAREQGEEIPSPQDAGDGVWWCPGEGAVLADGLWAGEHRFGSVVNLTGDHAPTLRLDRGAMLDDHEEHVAGLLTQKIPVLFEEGGRVLSLDWLSALVLGGRGQPMMGGAEPRGGLQGRLADLIAAEAVARGHRFAFRTHDEVEVVVNAAVVGCCPGDQYLVRTRRTGSAAVITDGSNSFGEWRARVWAATDEGCGVRSHASLPVARPTDEVILDCAYGVEEDEIPRLGGMHAAARASGLTPVQVRDRLKEFGLPLPDESSVRRLTDLREVDPLTLSRLLSSDGDGVRPWLSLDDDLDVTRLLAICDRSREKPRFVARLLNTLGFRVPHDDEFDSPVVQRRWPPERRNLATVVLRENFDPAGPELPRDRPVSPTHLVMAVTAFPELWDLIATTLTGAGYRLPQGLVPDPDLDPMLISRDGDGREPWLSPDRPFPLYLLLGIAHDRRTSEERLARRLVDLGFTPPELPHGSLKLSLRRLVEGLRRFYGTDDDTPFYAPDPVEPDAVLALAQEHDLPDIEVARRLTGLGYTVRGLDESPGQQGDYLHMALRSLVDNGGPPWLDRGRRVPRHHVVRVAHTYRLHVADVEGRLAQWGWDVTPEPPAGDWSAGDDLILLRRRSPGNSIGYAWLPADAPVPLTHVLHTAQRLARTPAEIARRLEQLGHTLPGDLEFTDPATP